MTTETLAAVGDMTTWGHRTVGQSDRFMQSHRQNIIRWHGMHFTVERIAASLKLPPADVRRVVEASGRGSVA